LNLLVGIEHDTPAAVVYETDRRFHPQLAPPGFVELTTNESGTQQV
jgi:hypothetical protein